MKELPILFSTEMVKAILRGEKTQTRRVVKNVIITKGQDDSFSFKHAKHKFPSGYGYSKQVFNSHGMGILDLAPYHPGDHMYVRETWQHTDHVGGTGSDEDRGYIYKASENGSDWENNMENWTWKPSLFMPKEAARIWLKVTNVKVERLQDISFEDALAEGVQSEEKGEPYLHIYKDYLQKGIFDLDAVCSYYTLWEKINGACSVQGNPWVWVYEFTVIKK